MKTAGLNPALLYGQAGGQAVSTTGGNNSGVSNAGTQAGAIAMQEKIMGINMMNTAADTALKMAQAQKEKEEAKKKAKETNLAEGQLKMQDIQLRLLKQQEDINANTIVEGAAAAQTAMSNMTITANQADISNKTKQAEIEKTYQELTSSLTASRGEPILPAALILGPRTYPR